MPRFAIYGEDLPATAALEESLRREGWTAELLEPATAEASVESSGASLVLIGTTGPTAVAFAESCLLAGRHVFYAGTPTPDAAALQRLSAAVHRSGCQLGALLPWRGDPLVRRAAQALQEGMVGAVLDVIIRWSAWTPPAESNSALALDAALVETMDLFDWFTGASVATVTAHEMAGGLQALAQQQHDVFAGLLQSDGGSAGLCHVDLLGIKTAVLAVDVIGAYGHLQLRLGAGREAEQRVEITSVGAGVEELKPAPAPRSAVAEFADYALHGGRTRVTTDSLLTALRASLAAREAARTSGPVILSESDQP